MTSEKHRLALARRMLRNRWMAGLVLAVLGVAGILWFTRVDSGRVRLTMSAGDVLSLRHHWLELLRDEAQKSRLDVTLQETAGSREALDEVAAGRLDAAFIQGDIGRHESTVRTVAVVTIEPLHLFVKPALLSAGLSGLRGKRINLSVPGSGTRKLALEALEFMGLKAGVDFQIESHSYKELEQMPAVALPDALFAVSALPWEPGRQLVQKHGYRLLELPFAAALAHVDQPLQDALIPAYTYSVIPPVPESPMHTIGTPLLVVANRDASVEAVTRLLESLCEGEFTRNAELPPIDPKGVEQVLEFPLHAGAAKYLHRNEPVVTGEFIESLENLRSFLMSGVVAGFLFWRWRASRRMIGFEVYFDQVTELESGAHQSDLFGKLDAAEARRLQQQLTKIKTDVLERHAEGVLKGEEQLTTFLLHVADVRRMLDTLTQRRA